MNEHGHVIDIDVGFDAAVQTVTDALKTEGFDVLTRVDIDDSFREELGVDFRHYAILGACNPRLAHKALSADPDIGPMLPCNVCVEETRIGSRIHLADPAAMMTTGGFDDNTEIRDLGVDMGARLARAAAKIASFSAPR